MARRNDPDRILTAKSSGAAMAVRDAIMLAPPKVVAAQCEALPDLWDRIDRVTVLAEEDK